MANCDCNGHNDSGKSRDSNPTTSGSFSPLRFNIKKCCCVLSFSSVFCEETVLKTLKSIIGQLGLVVTSWKKIYRVSHVSKQDSKELVTNAQ